MSGLAGSPIFTKTKGRKIEEVKEEVLPAKKKDKFSMTIAEAKKILDVREPLSTSQALWVQRFLEQKIGERCLPPQLAGGEALAHILLWLSPADSTALLNEIRINYRRAFHHTKPNEDKGSEFNFLLGVEQKISTPHSI